MYGQQKASRQVPHLLTVDSTLRAVHVVLRSTVLLCQDNSLSSIGRKTKNQGLAITQVKDEVRLGPRLQVTPSQGAKLITHIHTTVSQSFDSDTHPSRSNQD